MTLKKINYQIYISQQKEKGKISMKSNLNIFSCWIFAGTIRNLIIENSSIERNVQLNARFATVHPVLFSIGFDNVNTFHDDGSTVSFREAQIIVPLDVTLRMTLVMTERETEKDRERNTMPDRYMAAYTDTS